MSMGKNTEIVTYQQNEIAAIMKVLAEMSKTNNAGCFYAFAKEYGPRKICQILNNNGFENITTKHGFDVVDGITRSIFSKVANTKYINVLLHSPYYYSKYTQNPETMAMEEQNIWLSYNAIVDNRKVDIKKKFSIDNLSSLLENGNVVLLGIKENLIEKEKVFFENLIKVDQDYFSTVQDGFLQKNIFPSVKYADSEEICKNIDKFERKFPKLNQELFDVSKNILKKVLKFEVHNEQIVLANAKEKGQQQLKSFVDEYQSKVYNIQARMDLNEKLLQALGDNSSLTDYKFVNYSDVNNKKI